MTTDRDAYEAGKKAASVSAVRKAPLRYKAYAKAWLAGYDYFNRVSESTDDVGLTVEQPGAGRLGAVNDRT